MITDSHALFVVDKCAVILYFGAFNGSQSKKIAMMLYRCHPIRFLVAQNVLNVKNTINKLITI